MNESPLLSTHGSKEMKPLSKTGDKPDHELTSSNRGVFWVFEK